MIETLIIIIGFGGFSIILFNILVKLNANQPFLYSIVIIGTIIFGIYSFILKKGIKAFFDKEVYPQNSDILLSYMKSKHANDEKEKIVKSINNEPLKETLKSTKRRL